MKRKFSIVFSLFLLLTAIPLILEAKGKGEASIKFEETIFDFGNIKEDGGPVTHEFKFTNAGSAALVIHSAKTECGCTASEYTEKPIAPGKTGSIKVTYHPLGRPGGFTKAIIVRCNGAPGKVVLKIRGSVIPKQ